MRKIAFILAGLALLFGGLTTGTRAQNTSAVPNPHSFALDCDDFDSGLCRERVIRRNYEGRYSGHDEPALIFYSNTPGAGDSGVYLITLPKDSPKVPTQDGKGGTFNFQLHPAFWIGMNMCDSQSYPNFSAVCNPDTDDNIFENLNPNSPKFIGKHPGTAFLEMQFYPPGWGGSPQLVDPANYFAALNIDSLGLNGANVTNNNTCLNSVGEETVNFAVVTKNGVPLSPPNPAGVNFGQNNFDLNNVLFMAPGDKILVILHDTKHGLEVILQDLNTGQTGTMVASAANGFGNILFQPNGTTCNTAPYDFHPMYSTSNERTRTVWSVGTSNSTFTDELGHWEFCNAADEVDFPFLCTVPGVEEGSPGLDSDDDFCITPGGQFLPGPPFIQVGACTDTELDYDGVSYGLNWPGTLADVHKDLEFHPRPIRITGPLFLADDGNSAEPQLRNYDRVAFETDIPSFDPNCNFQTGAGCSVPAQGMQFYPYYTIFHGKDGDQDEDVCRWQLGGGLIPGTTNNFGGSPTTAWGTLFFQQFQTGATTTGTFGTVFRHALDHNPCKLEVNDKIEDHVEQLLKHQR
jgi:hypothetical protein